jgi:hypothetical protein
MLAGLEQQPQGAGDQFAHQGRGFQRIALDDRVGHASVIDRAGPADAGIGVGAANAETQRGLGQIGELAHETVVAGLDDRPVEGDVGLEGIVVAPFGREHPVYRIDDRRALRPGGAIGRQARRARLDRHAHLGELDQQVDRERAVEQPFQHVRIQQVPAVFGLNHCARPLPGPQQPLGGQHLDRFAHDRTAGAILLAELRLERKACLGGELLGDDGAS